MAYIEPNSTVKILVGVPFDPTYENTMYFSTLANQTEYMLDKTAYTFENLSYQRKTKGVIRIGWIEDAINGTIISKLYNANYMMFKNTSFENKWFYAFVRNVEYVNNNTIDVFYDIDVIQTWMFAYTFNMCVIEREHTTTDVRGEHTIPESFELGEYLFHMIERVGLTPCVVAAVTSIPGSNILDPWIPVPAKIYRGRPHGVATENTGDILSGAQYLYANMNDQSAVTALSDYLEAVSNAGAANSIVSIFIMPQEFLSTDGSSKQPIMKEYTIPTTLGSYTPRNNKMLTWPYIGMYVSDIHGNAKVLPYEFFLPYQDGKVHFELWGNTSTDPGVILMPKAYKNETYDINYDEVMSVNGFPMCEFNYDTYKAWLAQNVGLYATTAASALLGAGGAALQANTGMHQAGVVGDYARAMLRDTNESMRTRNLTGAVSSALDDVKRLVAQDLNHKVLPESNVGNTNGNLMYQAGLMTFLVGYKYIKPEYATIIDKFFDMFGYEVRRVGIPNIAARPCYTYVKTIDASIDGFLPVDAAEEIQNIYNKGIRFWKQTAVFGSFSPLDNDNRPGA